jgi:hypothetical protein
MNMGGLLQSFGVNLENSNQQNISSCLLSVPVANQQSNCVSLLLKFVYLCRLIYSAYTNA